jgi:surface-adhesin protein E
VYAEWVSVDSKVEEGLTVYTVYVDRDTIRRNGDVVKLWVMMDFKTRQIESSPPYLSVKSHREIDCTEERIRLVAVTAFSGNMGSGAILYRYSNSKDQGIPVEPGSVAQSLWNFACSKK